MGGQPNSNHSRCQRMPSISSRRYFAGAIIATAMWLAPTNSTCFAQAVITQPILPLRTTAPAPVSLSEGTTFSTTLLPAPEPTRTPLSVATRLTNTNLEDSPYTPTFDGGSQNRVISVDPLTRYGSLQVQSARQSASQFRMFAQSNAPIVAKTASANATLAEQWANLAETYRSLSFRVSDAATKLNATRHDLDDVRAKLAQFGLTPTIGMLLRHKKDQLENFQGSGSDPLFASEALAASRQKQLEIEMIRHDGHEPVRQTAEILNEAGIAPSSYEYSQLSSQIQDLLRQRNRWISSLKLGYQDYEQLLSELDSTATASAKLTTDYRKLISRHIIWIRSGNTVDLGDVQALQGGLESLFNSRRSAELGYSLKRKWEANRITSLGLFFGILVVMLARWRAKSWLIGIGSRKIMRETTPNARKVAAGFLTVLVAAAIPGILYAIAYWLEHDVVFAITLQAATALYAAALVALMVELLRQLLCNHGYLDKHVAVELPRRQRAFAYLTLIGFCLILAAYLVTLAGQIDHGMWRDSVSRFGLFAALLLSAWTLHLGLRPHGGFLEPLIAKFGGSVIHRIRLLIYLAGIGFPLAMIALSALGYGFTAHEVIKRAIITLVSFMIAATLWSGVKILSAGAWHFLTGSSRPAGAGYSSDGQPELVTGVLSEHFLELKYHLAFLCQCTLLLGAVVYCGWLWIDVFPNARMGNPVVWTVQDTVTHSSVGTNGQLITRQATEIVPVTALHLVLAVATLFVAFQLAKLLPALFDALVLQRVSFDEGMEHLTLVTGRILLFGIGCFIACKWIGLRWESLQWLAVGLTIGLGFGLQDMVRNLFGGVVVLFEKPARLGDLITVGRVTGRVAAQKFRTTVLSDEEGREVIVPNKNFISEEVVNWMGAGRLKAIPIEVAVTRDQRPADVCRMLQELVIEQPHILLAPAPQATLVCVGKTSQRIEIRAWIESGKDATRFRETLLSVVSSFLKEKELLAGSQPTQPPLSDTAVDSVSRNSNPLLSTKRKRSA
jgi:potassium-dependent mechanosensitive channel